MDLPTVSEQMQRTIGICTLHHQLMMFFRMTPTTQMMMMIPWDLEQSLLTTIDMKVEHRPRLPRIPKAILHPLAIPGTLSRIKRWKSS